MQLKLFSSQDNLEWNLKYGNKNISNLSKVSVRDMYYGVRRPITIKKEFSEDHYEKYMGTIHVCIFIELIGSQICKRSRR